jgi:hypothetical protein
MKKHHQAKRVLAVAIAEGAKAGVAINRALLQEDGLG